MPDTVAPTGPRTPDFDDSALGPKSTRYVDVDALPWIDTVYAGIDMKILFKDEARGLMTALFRWQPGSELPMHEHTDIEQSFVLEGSLHDDEGICAKGQFAWRPAGSTHNAWSPDGCLIYATFQKPNRFLAGPEAS
jgi:anti-sigma factor ChrR (cupin superfamily)